MRVKIEIIKTRLSFESNEKQLSHGMVMMAAYPIPDGGSFRLRGMFDLISRSRTALNNVFYPCLIEYIPLISDIIFDRFACCACEC